MQLTTMPMVHSAAAAMPRKEMTLVMLFVIASSKE
jgi:hypothetical protein